MSGGFDWQVIIKHIPFLWEGMQVTFLLTLLAIVGGILGGTLLALCRLSKFAALSWFAGSYVNFFRSMPLILVIFWFYFLVPMLLGRPVGSFYSVLIAFTLFEAAYYCEIIRAGISSIGRGQVQAAQAIGLTYQQSMRYIVLPQAFRNTLPATINQVVITFKETSIVTIIGFFEVMASGNAAVGTGNWTAQYIEVYVFVGAIYFLFVFGLSRYGSYLEKRVRLRVA